MHYAGGILAVTKPEGMPQLVNGFLYDPLPVYLLGLNRANGFLETMCGHHTCLSTQLGLPIDVGKDGNEEVYMGSGNNLDRVKWSQPRKLFQDRRGMVLGAGRVQGKVDFP